MTRIVVNRCHGGFGLSHKAVLRYLELIGKECFTYIDARNSILKKTSNENPEKSVLDIYHYLTKDCGESFNSRNNWEQIRDAYFSERDISRDDPFLVQVVEELGEESYGTHAELEIVEIPDDVNWCIGEYDGYESIEERHRSW